MKAESFIGWIDMTAEDLNRARDYLSKLEEGTLDELGFGILRDFFSERFFPATSTVMSIARQYVLVPFCCLHLERRILEEGWDLPRARKELYDLENHLRGCVSDIREKDVQRLPSAIYWPALRKLGIFLEEGSIQTYLRGRVEASGRRYRDDDKGAHAPCDETGQWDPELLRLYDKEKADLIEGDRFRFDVPEDREANIRLTRAEARYLQRVYSRHAGSDSGPSIMSHILQQPREPAGIYPWVLDHPPGLRVLVQDARKFSLLVGGARLIYYQMLVEARKAQALPELESPNYEEGFSVWWDSAREELLRWDLAAYLCRVRPALRPIRKDGQFLEEFLDLFAKASDAKEFFRAELVRRMIRERERRVRPHKSRLRNPKYLEQWQPQNRYDPDDSDAVYGFYFRGKIAVSLCREIIAGLARDGRDG